MQLPLPLSLMFTVLLMLQLRKLMSYLYAVLVPVHGGRQQPLLRRYVRDFLLDLVWAIVVVLIWKSTGTLDIIGRLLN
ncbi:hypothetical protein PG993_007948 [Apiospora rasikravindrae]|uniref:Uncharacterized protein n=1 Tax=Apiospora rasikravindrae TaxID=990691 RepID=A0ABR1SYY5_9PEZI